MRRLEQRKGKAGKFWEISLDGPELIIRQGKIGGRGTVERKLHTTVEAAWSEAHDKHRARLAKGWVEVGVERWTALDLPRRTGPREPTLEAAIVDDLDDSAAWAVYADWLQAHDDPWGERIALSLAQAARPQPAPVWQTGILPPLAEADAPDALDLRVAELDEQAREQLYGPALARLMARRDFRELVELRTRHGFIVGATLRATLDNPRWGGPSLHHLLRALLDSPATRFLTVLGVRIHVHHCGAQVRELLPLLAEHEGFPALRSFFIDDRTDDELPRIRLGSFDWLFARAPRLESFVVEGARLELTRLEHPRIRSLVLAGDGLRGGSLRALGSARLPACERLCVELGDGAPAHLQPLFAGEGLPRLRRLEFGGWGWGDAIVEALSNSPLLARLELLGLVDTGLGMAGVEHIAANSGAFAHLRDLRIGGNGLPHEALRRLSDLGPRLHTDHRSWMI